MAIFLLKCGVILPVEDFRSNFDIELFFSVPFICFFSAIGIRFKLNRVQIDASLYFLNTRLHTISDHYFYSLKLFELIRVGNPSPR